MHWFIDPIKSSYSDFSGRATRQQYWMFVLIYLLIYIGLSVVDGILGFGMESVGFLSAIFWLVTLVPAVAIASRRLHDINKSGWWQLISLVPVVGWIIAIVWLASKGQAEANQYGPSPYGAAAAVPAVDPNASTPPQEPPVPGGGEGGQV